MKLLSLLVCFVMMLSGGYMSDDPTAAAATQVTIRDLVVEIQGEEYPLSPSITFGASTENNTALVDLFMTVNDQTLFPVQAKIDDAGAGVLLGSSGTAYTFTPEFFDEIMDGEEIPDEIPDMFNDYFALLHETTNMMDPAFMAETYKITTDQLIALGQNSEMTEATFYANGEEQTGQRFTIELDGDAFVEWMDSSYALLPEEYTAAYFDLFNNMSSLLGTPEINNFADMMDFSGMQMGLSGEITYNETSAECNVVYHTLIDQSSIYIDAGYTAEEIADMGIEPISMDIPMLITVHDSNSLEFSSSFEEDMLSMELYCTITGSDVNMNLLSTIDEEVGVSFDLSFYTEDDNSKEIYTSLIAGTEDTNISLSTSTEADAAGSSTFVFVGYEDTAFSGSANFHVDVTHEAITDRVSAANVQTISSTEELDGTTGTSVYLAAMSMMSDVEKLLNDESIAALIPAVEQMLGYSEVYIDESATEEILVDPIPAFPEPQFTFFPEGYVLLDSYFDSTFGSYSYTFAREDDEYGEYAIYVDISSHDKSVSEVYSYYSFSDGQVTPVDGEMISASTYSDEDFYFISMWSDIDNYSIYVTSYATELTADDLANVIAGIAFGE